MMRAFLILALMQGNFLVRKTRQRLQAQFSTGKKSNGEGAAFW